MPYIPKNVEKIASILADNGFECYIVGGAVRDYIMNTTPHDWDLATNATPQQVMELMHAAPTGIKYGTVTAYDCEITTYRKDQDYLDGRHPDQVEYAKTIKEDLSRRDLTINAMAMDIHGNIVDPYGGRQDIENKLIRTVGDPNKRFNEDKLRMLRAIRFCAKFGFNMDNNTYNAIQQRSDQISTVSAERIQSEMTKLITSPYPGHGLEIAHKTGILEQILPEFDRCFDCQQNTPYHYTDVANHSIETLLNVPPEKTLCWAALLHDIAKPDVKTIGGGDIEHFYGHAQKSQEIATAILRRLHFSNTERKEIEFLVREHDTSFQSLTKIRRFAGNAGKDLVDKLYQLQVADAKAHNPEFVPLLLSKKEDFYQRCIKCIDDKTAIKMDDLDINGKELMDIGIKGQKIQEFKDYIYQQCLGNPSLNNNEKLCSQAKLWHQKDLEGKAPVVYKSEDLVR